MIDLTKVEKRQQKVVDLKKLYDISDVQAQVVLCLDYSASMDTMYRSGLVQETVERILPIGLAFDVDKSVDVYLFHGGVIKLKSAVTLQNLDGYVNNQTRGIDMGGTNYAPIINKVVADFSAVKSGFLGIGGSKPSTMNNPVYVIFITDGNCADKSDSVKAITEASKHGIFFQFVGIGKESFEFLQRLDTLPGRLIDNANFFKIEDLKLTGDQELYNKLMAEFPSWIKLAKQHSLIL